MKPLYKFKITNKKKKKKERKRYQYPPSLILSPITRIPFLAGVVLRRTCPPGLRVHTTVHI